MTIKKAYQAHDLTEALDRSWVGENDFYIADEDIEIIVHAAAAWEGYITGDAEIIQTDQGVGIRGVKMPGPEAE